MVWSEEQCTNRLQRFLSFSTLDSSYNLHSAGWFYLQPWSVLKLQYSYRTWERDSCLFLWLSVYLAVCLFVLFMAGCTVIHDSVCVQWTHDLFSCCLRKWRGSFKVSIFQSKCLFFKCEIQYKSRCVFLTQAFWAKMLSFYH